MITKDQLELLGRLLEEILRRAELLGGIPRAAGRAAIGRDHFTTIQKVMLEKGETAPPGFELSVQCGRDR